MEDRKELTGILSFNDRKTNDRQPDYRGSFLNQTKQKFSFSAWKNSFAPKAWKDTGSGVLFKNHNKGARSRMCVYLFRKTEEYRLLREKAEEKENHIKSHVVII